MNKEWSKEWPTEPGWYWFCGWKTKWLFDNKSIPLLQTLKVRISGNNYPMYICDGHFMFKEDHPIGFFLPLETPELPEMPRYDTPEEDL